MDNAAMAVLAAESLSGFLPGEIGPDAIERGLASARWPGRLQVVGTRPLFLVDGAHNPAAASALAYALRSLRDRGGFRRLHLILGILKEKDLGGIAQPLLDLEPRVIVTRGASERFIDPHEVAAALRSFGCEPVTAVDLPGAIEAARAGAAHGDAIVLCGSLYLVGDALKALGREAFPFDAPFQ